MQQQQQLTNHKILTSNPYENQEELMLRHQVGSDMLLKQLTDHQQPHHYHQGHKQQKQLQLELKSLPGVNMLIKDQDYQPCTGNRENKKKYTLMIIPLLNSANYILAIFAKM